MSAATAEDKRQRCLRTAERRERRTERIAALAKKIAKEAELRALEAAWPRKRKAA